ncbi:MULTISPECIES: TetR/AcrR family transcriptional regulator [unclassified Streptomyces]|uniref:TetR/AcrR family transcriptional regulator n=1 Tax=unclassified Streptomyces TaxID=2593676 RepID=UPI002256FC3E|nr:MULTISPECIES: TetR/AcrR family transcriptional regulator [unclassified Streptomyces]MCX5336014.1 TetR/AcrR family transcriptional regulator [Streptomyces sp. NBC_00140]MCX5366734.1 TetR/AcrR family transcriptional regulator [Streptomyces sp. NBC_00124]
MIETQPVRRRRGRGARERILKAATELFIAQGINATGMDQLSTVAEVSKRTLYTHFPSKDELVGAYLESLVDALLPVLPSPTQPAPSPREQLLAIFDRKSAETTAPFRGCPFLNVSVEVPDPEHSAHRLAVAYKREFTHRLTNIARQAGAADPEKLGEQLSLLFDGAAARGTALNDTRTGACARSIAELLVDAALAEVGPPSP